MRNLRARDRKRLGKVLRQWRESRELSQMALADELGVSQATVSDWERAKKMPRLASVLALARVSRGELSVEMWGEGAR